jgi:phage recombination protein Bet
MNTAVAKPKLVEKFASKFSIDAEKLLPILKATAFKQKEGEVSNEQMAALLVVADQYGLNPFTREIFAFPDKQNGIVPVVGVDGWSRIVNDHEQSDGFEFRQSDEMVTMPDALVPCPKWMEVVIYRKDRERPTIVREYLDEVYRPLGTYKDGNKHKAGPWQTHTKRFLRHKTFIQGARIAYGFAGIYDEDEAERIIEGEVSRVPEAQTERSATAALKSALVPAANGAAAQAPKGEPITQREPGSDDGPNLQEQVANAIEELQNFNDGETMRLFAEFLPDYVRGHEDFTRGYHKRLGELAEAATKGPGKGARTPGTPRMRKLYIEKIEKAGAPDFLNVVYDETRAFDWTADDAKALSAAYDKRARELAP